MCQVDWKCRIESLRGHGFPSLVIVVFCQVQVFATSRSLVQRCPTECFIKTNNLNIACFFFYLRFPLSCFDTFFHPRLIVLPYSSSLFTHLILLQFVHPMVYREAQFIKMSLWSSLQPFVNSYSAFCSPTDESVSFNRFVARRLRRGKTLHYIWLQIWHMFIQLFRWHLQYQAAFHINYTLIFACQYNSYVNMVSELYKQRGRVHQDI